jgi:hypothetical protein
MQKILGFYSGDFSLRALNLVNMLALAFILPVTAGAGEAPSRANWPATDFSHTSVPMAKITVIGARDTPPTVTRPEFASLQSQTDIGGLEPVVSVEINGVSKAYPLQILAQHQVVNDVIGDVPVAVTFCPLRKSAAVFDRRANGHTLVLANTGATYDNNILLYDTESGSWWQQINGKAVVGSLSGQSLKLIPARLESFAQFKSRLPRADKEMATVMRPTELSKRPILQTDADNLVIPVTPTKTDSGKTTHSDRVVVVGEDDWTLSVLQRLGSTSDAKNMAPGTAHKDKKGQSPFKVYYKNGTLEVPYAQDDEDKPKKK